ncbi:protein-disulfide isomerase [Kitasatospora sp. MAA4]|uniref:DsbA family protein n=1 Tax=Kitasatospora sp. MAA4 TaxID=3035093 RepID=UPI002476F896|nr:thioredoxin domain-containing protein [Kitasatospora sp. MAA4]MDH6132559.1 protein-disulfide isomerase [Kitasatospora sp. MAA4]
MSEKNREGKRTARERMREDRAAQEARESRKKKMIVLGSVVAVLAVAAGVGVFVQNQRSKPDTPTASPAGAIGNKNLVIPDGPANAPSTLTVYEDPRCPACGQFERQFAPTVDQLQDQGKIYGNYHIVSFIDRHDGGKGSKNGANALACAQDAGYFRAYHDVLYRNQPDETVDSWKDKSQLITLAKQVPGLDSPTFESCVNSNKFGSWVSAVEQDFDKSGYTSTPTILLNGKPIYPKNGNDEITPDNLVKWVNEANAGKTLGTTGSASASPAPTSTAAETDPNQPAQPAPGATG